MLESRILSKIICNEKLANNCPGYQFDQFGVLLGFLSLIILKQ